MTLKYDFDIFDIMPKDVFANPDMAASMARIGINQNSVGNKMALFRNQSTVDAILAGPPDLKEYLSAAGFGFTIYDSGAPKNRYPPEDEGMRLHIIKKLTELLPDYDLKPANPGDPLQGGFSFGDFMLYIATAEPTAQGSAASSPASFSSYATGPDAADPRSANSLLKHPVFWAICAFMAVSYVLLG